MTFMEEIAAAVEEYSTAYSDPTTEQAMELLIGAGIITDADAPKIEADPSDQKIDLQEISER